MAKEKPEQSQTEEDTNRWTEFLREMANIDYADPKQDYSKLRRVLEGVWKNFAPMVAGSVGGPLAALGISGMPYEMPEKFFRHTMPRAFSSFFTPKKYAAGKAQREGESDLATLAALGQNITEPLSGQYSSPGMDMFSEADIQAQPTSSLLDAIVKSTGRPYNSFMPNEADAQKRDVMNQILQLANIGEGGFYRTDEGTGLNRFLTNYIGANDQSAATADKYYPHPGGSSELDPVNLSQEYLVADVH
jgi:hypothetical protein